MGMWPRSLFKLTVVNDGRGRSKYGCVAGIPWSKGAGLQADKAPQGHSRAGLSLEPLLGGVLVVRLEIALSAQVPAPGVFRKPRCSDSAGLLFDVERLPSG